MREISNTDQSTHSHRRTVATVGLLAAAIIITYSLVQLSGGDRTADLPLWLGIIAAFTLVIYALKTGKSPIIQYGILAIGLLLVVFGIISALASGIFRAQTLTPMMITGFIAAGMILITLGVRMKERTGDLGIQDERSLRIGTYGISYSWYLTFLVVTCIGWVTGTKVVTIDGSMICLLLIILMPVSAMIFQWYFNRRGDVY